MRYPETAALVKSARLRKGLSQEKAAAAIGCSRIQWINWEQGHHRPEKYVRALVDVIGVDEQKLASADGLDEADLMSPLTRAIEDIVAAQVRRLIKTERAVA